MERGRLGRRQLDDNQDVDDYEDVDDYSHEDGDVHAHAQEDERSRALSSG
jgi:hypothetical protein